MMNQQGGLIKLIILIIVVIFILSYLGISLRSIIEGESFQSNWNYVWEGTKNVWNEYLSNPAKYLWYNIFIDLIWESFIDNMERIKVGQEIESIENAPQMNLITPTP
ncbi:hypothetical protein KJ763_01060 [Patescibacteria group bacterium]|nr:hypothetical protein [Patescibacteria group bacterium]